MTESQTYNTLRAYGASHKTAANLANNLWIAKQALQSEINQLFIYFALGA